MVGAGLTHGGGVLTAGAVGLTPADGMRQSAPGPNGYPGLRWARNGLGSERATARRPGPGREAGAHSEGKGRRGDKEAEASVPVKRGVKELYVQIPSHSINSCRDFEKHKKVSCRTFVAKIFWFYLFCCHLRIYIFDFCLRKLR